jgi:hypothetical protein
VYSYFSGLWLQFPLLPLPGIFRCKNGKPL